MTDIEMLPLPEALFETGSRRDLFNVAQMDGYAFNVAVHNVKERDAEIEALRAEVERLRLLAGNQHELMKAHGVPLPEDYALPAAADAFVKEYVARRERATRAEAEVEALRRDAERYRWLRDRHDKTHQDWHVRDQWNNVPAIGGLDAAIDAAREARNG